MEQPTTDILRSSDYHKLMTELFMKGIEEKTETPIPVCSECVECMDKYIRLRKKTRKLKKFKALWEKRYWEKDEELKKSRKNFLENNSKLVKYIRKYGTDFL